MEKTLKSTTYSVIISLIHLHADKHMLRHNSLSFSTEVRKERDANLS